MTKEELNERILIIGMEATIKKNDLYKEYALSHNPYKVGDVITDHIGSGRIRSIYVTIGQMDEPMCVYICDNLTKSGKISKREPQRHIYQKNIRK